MRTIKHLNRRKISIWHFFSISAIALVLGAIAGMVQAQATDQNIVFEFADGYKTFCVDQGRMSVGHMDFVDDQASGFTTPEMAVDDYLADLHHAATGAEAPVGKELPQELWQLLEPARQFQVTKRQDVNENLIYFDLPSSQAGLLEARFVVERFGEGFQLTATYICEAQLVSDPAKFERLWSEEVEKHAES